MQNKDTYEVHDTTETKNGVILGPFLSNYAMINDRWSVHVESRPYIRNDCVLMNDMTRWATLCPVYKKISIKPIARSDVPSLIKIYVSCPEKLDKDVVSYRLLADHVGSVLHNGQFVYIEWSSTKYIAEIKHTIPDTCGILTQDTNIIVMTFGRNTIASVPMGRSQSDSKINRSSFKNK